MPTKKLIHSFIAGFFLVITLAGCGGGERTEAEVIDDFESTFRIESAAGDNSRSSAGSRFEGSGGSGSSSYARSSASTTSDGTEASSGGESTNSSSSSGEVEVPPEVQRIAGNVASSLRAGDFGSAVQDLDLLMNESGLSIAQRRAVRNTMAAVQRKLAMDPTISDQQKQRVQEVLAR